MRSFILQTAAITRMNITSLPDRLGSSFAAILALALTVLVLLGFLAVSTGIDRTVSGSGSDRVAVILQEGAPDEASSMISRESLSLVESAPDIARNGEAAILSAERFVVVKGRRRADGREANISLRGIGVEGMAVRPGATLVKGRMFTPGTDEMIVGQALANTFAGFGPGETVRIGAKTWRVVGVFQDSGGVNESQALVDIDTLQNLYAGTNGYESVRALLPSASRMNALNAWMNANPRLKLKARSEREVLGEQSASIGVVLRALGWPLALALAFGALIGAMNAMYTSVSERRGEIAMLRALGFSPAATFIGAIVEAVALTCIGAVIGAVAGLVVFNGLHSSTMGVNFTTMVYRLQLSPSDFQAAFVLAIVVGLAGGLLPAFRAARIPILALTRE